MGNKIDRNMIIIYRLLNENGLKTITIVSSESGHWLKNRIITIAFTQLVYILSLRLEKDRVAALVFQSWESLLSFNQ